MTAKQKEVLDQVHNLLTEHFDGMVYVVNIEDVEDGTDHQTVGGFNGGWAMALGLCEYQMTYIRARISSEGPTQTE